jgi:uncharacterized UBP type Zn finger protein
MGPCECNSCRNQQYSYGELDTISYNLKDNYEEKYPIKMEEIKQLAVLKKENNYLEAALCAILTELENRKAYKPVVNAASKNGMIDIDSFWAKHQSKDEERLKTELDKFSEHEKEILKRLLQ